MNDPHLGQQFIAEMGRLLPALRKWEQSAAEATSQQSAMTAVAELHRLATAATQLCSTFDVQDCTDIFSAMNAMLARASRTESAPSDIGSALSYAERRVSYMALAGSIVHATDAERREAAALAQSLPSHATSNTAPPAVSIDAGHSGQGGSSSSDMLELVRRFQASSLRPASQSPAASAPASSSSAPGDMSDRRFPSPMVPREPGQVRRQPTAEEMDIIPPEMKRLFVAETKGDLDDIRQGLLTLEQEPENTAVVAEMGRILHKIRGAAGTLNFDGLAALIFLMEDLIKSLQAKRLTADTDTLSALFDFLALLEASRTDAAADLPDDPGHLERARHIHDVLTSEVAEAQSSTAHRTPSVMPSPDSHTLRTQRPAEGSPLMRVDAARLDALMAQVGALAMNRSSLGRTREEVGRVQGEMIVALERLTQLSRQLTDIYPSGALRAEREMHDSGPQRTVPRSTYEAAEPQWDELQLDRYTEFDDALRSLTEAVSDMTTVSDSLRMLLHRLVQATEAQENVAQQIQQDVMQIRLVQFESLAPRLQVEARQLAESQGKAVNLVVSGETTEIDRDVSEALAEPLMQLVRNAVVHGIETPEERRERGKPESGHVWLRAFCDGNDVSIEIGDDGAGVNPHHLIASAKMLGMLDNEMAEQFTSEQALDLMFWHGITTQEQADVFGGRGVGLDEVRTAIERLKGTITVESEPGNGSIFRIRVPVSLSILRALHVRVKGQMYALPFAYVRSTLAITETTVQPPTQAGGQRMMHIVVPTDSDADPVREEDIPLVSLGNLLGFTDTSDQESLAVLLEIGNRHVALAVDEVLEERDVVVRSLPGHLRRKAIRGASIAPDGTLLLLVDVPELLTSTMNPRQQTEPRAPQQPLSTNQATDVLVVDDSVFIRRTLELMLRRAGYEVRLARDGVEALTTMMERAPRVVILDIEMPRLDGFELLSVMRGSPQLAHVRVAMLTSRGGERHKAHALALGADDYLIKPCPQEVLLETVRRLAVGATVRA